MRTTERLRTPTWQLLVSLLLFCGCTGIPTDGSGPDPGEDEAVASDQLAVTTPTWDTPACSSAALETQGRGSCGGPWKYTRALTEVSRDPYCNARECVVAGSCYLWKNGPAPTTYNSSYQSGAAVTVTCREVCSTAPDGDCTTTCSPTPPSATACANTAAARKTALSNQYGAAITAEGGVGFVTRMAILDKVKATGSISGSHISTTTTHNAKFITTVDKDLLWCSISTQEPQPNYAQNSACACAQTDWVSCEHPVGSVTEYTAPGTLRPGGTWISQQECTTCDNVSWSGSSAADKYGCLASALSGPVPTTTTAEVWKRAIVTRLELLFELNATNLSQAQRDTIVGLYGGNSGYPTCEQQVALSATCRTVAESAGMIGLLQSCQALGADYVPTASVDAQLPACMTLYDKLANVAAGTCRDELSDLVSTINEALIDHRFDAIGLAAPALGGLVQALNAIDDWYDHASLLGDPAYLQKHTSMLLGRFWEHTYAAAAPAPQIVTDSDVQQQLTSMLETGLTADWAVLSAAFSDSSHLDSPPLLAVVGDALRSTTDRLETVSAMHDAACRYKSCNDNIDSTLTSQTWRALAAVLDVTDLSSALTAGALLKSAHLPLWNAIDDLRKHRDRLQTAYTAAGGGDLSDMFADEVPAPAKALAVLLGGAREHWIRYGNFGLFLSAGERPLYAGMQNKGMVTNGISTHEGAMGLAINNYAATKVNVVNALLAQMRNQQEAQSLRDRMLANSHRIADILGDMGGLQAREDEEKHRYADYEAAFDAMRNAGVFDSNMSAQTTNVGTAMLSGNDSRFTLGAPRDPSTLGALRNGTPWKEPLDAGQVLHLNVTGNWAPTCALQGSNIPTPVEGVFDNLASSAVTGPEGYMMNWSNGDFAASTWSHEKVERKSYSIEACLQASIGPDMKWWSVQLVVKACAGLERSKTDSEGTNGGSDQRQGASFTAGIHLDETPYPEAPAGALLLVVTERGNPHNVFDVQVVNRQMVYMADQDSDTYLIVNDVHSPSCSFRPNDKLTIEGQKVTSFGAIAKKIRAAMAATLVSIRGQETAILEQGALMPSDATLMRQAARQALALSLGFDVTALPAAVMEFYDTWVTAEVASLERRAAIRALQRDLDRTFLDADALGNELAASGAQSRLLALVPRWTLRNLQAQRVASEGSALLRLLTDYVPPVFELRYSKALVSLRTKPNNKITPLMNIDFAAPMENAYAALDAFALDVRDTLEFAALDSADYGTAMAAIAFPRPSKYGKTGTGPAGCELLGTCNLGTSQPQMLWQTVEMERAQQAWKGIDGHGWSTFTVTPDDLYNLHGGNARLHCSDGAPVVKKMALFVVGGQTEYDSAFYRPPMLASMEQVFPTGAGALAYSKVDSDWLSMGVPVFGGAEGQAVQRVHTDNSHVGEGLSPFGHWDIDLGSFPFATDTTISALVMVFELETRPVAPPGVAIEACMQP
jgi:hypothetical protein